MANGLMNQKDHDLLQAQISDLNREKVNNNVIAPEYSADETYAVGALMIHEGTLYMCAADISVGEQFDPAKWYAVNLNDLINGDNVTFAYIKRCLNTMTEAQAREHLTGKVVDDLWINDYGAVFHDPLRVVDVKQYEKADGTIKVGAKLRRMYGAFNIMKPALPCQEEATEMTALDGVTYFGHSGSTVSADSLTVLTLSPGETIPYDSYDKVFRAGFDIRDKSICLHGANDVFNTYIFQYINSDAEKGGWFEAAYIGQVEPENYSTIRGYEAGCSSELLSYIEPTKRKVYVTQSTNGYRSERVCDFYIDTVQELNSVGNRSNLEGTPDKYWIEATGIETPLGTDTNKGTNAGRAGEMKLGEVSYISGRYCYLASIKDASLIWQNNIGTGRVFDGYNFVNSNNMFFPCCTIFKD